MNNVGDSMHIPITASDKKNLAALYIGNSATPVKLEKEKLRSLLKPKERNKNKNKNKKKPLHQPNNGTLAQMPMYSNSHRRIPSDMLNFESHDLFSER